MKRKAFFPPIVLMSINPNYLHVQFKLNKTRAF